MTTKSLRKQLMAAIATLLVAAIALGSSTFAWFITNTNVKAEKVNLTATASNTLLISTDGENSGNAWGTTRELKQNTTITLDSVVYPLYTLTKDDDSTVTVYLKSGKYYLTTDTTGATEITPKASKTPVAISPDFQELTPVSTIGGTAATLSFFKSKEWSNDSTVSGINAGYRASEFEQATTGYYNTEFLLKASQTSGLYIDANTVFAALEEANTKLDLNKVLRLGLVVSKQDNASPKTFIWQIDDTKLNDTGSSITTSNTLNNGTAVEGIQYAISSATAAAQITATNLVSNKVPLLSSQSTAIASDTLLTTAQTTGKQRLYDFTVTPTDLEPICKVNLYIWMEGCDEDCTAANAKAFTEASKTIVASLGFSAGQA